MNCVVHHHTPLVIRNGCPGHISASNRLPRKQKSQTVHSKHTPSASNGLPNSIRDAAKGAENRHNSHMMQLLRFKCEPHHVCDFPHMLRRQPLYPAELRAHEGSFTVYMARRAAAIVRSSTPSKLTADVRFLTAASRPFRMRSCWNAE